MQIAIRPFHIDDMEPTISLWQACGLTRPWNDPRKDIQRKLDEAPALFLLAVHAERVVGSVMAGYDGHRGWIYYLAVLPDYQSHGIGKKLVLESEDRLLALGCPKIQLMIRRDNHTVSAFYQAMGYEASDVLVLGKRLIEDI